MNQIERVRRNIEFSGHIIEEMDLIIKTNDLTHADSLFIASNIMMCAFESSGMTDEDVREYLRVLTEGFIEIRKNKE